MAKCRTEVSSPDSTSTTHGTQSHAYPVSKIAARALMVRYRLIALARGMPSARRRGAETISAAPACVGGHASQGGQMGKRMTPTQAH